MKFPNQNSFHAEARIFAGVHAFAEIACKAAEDGEWSAEFAHDGLTEFIHTLCVYDVTSHRQSWGDRFSEDITRKITNTQKWLSYLERLDKLGEEQASCPFPFPDDSKGDRKALRNAYQSRFPEAFIKDICWAARQHQREWRRWISGKSKDGSKPDRCFRAILTSSKSPKQHRPEQRPKDWE